MIDTDEYKTILTPSEGIFKDKGSKFHGYLYPIHSIEEVEYHLSDIKTVHPKARHVCYAYRIGIGDQVFRINDDGEPSGSAGRPIYNELLSNDLTDTLAAVVRYFGGTKLGIPGLINAYKTATSDAISQTEIITRYITKEIIMTYPVSDMGKIYDLLKKLDITEVESRFDPNPHMLMQVRTSILTEIVHAVKAAYLGYGPSDIPVGHKVDGLTFVVDGEEQ